MTSLLLDKQILALDLHRPRTHRLLRRTAQDRAGSYVELTTMAGARDRSAVQLAFRERASHVGTRVIERVEMSTHACNSHFGSRDIDDSHLSRGNAFSIFDSYRHGFIS
jgi:hypothetical protein